jgi:hypothetical protein
MAVLDHAACHLLLFAQSHSGQRQLPQALAALWWTVPAWLVVHGAPVPLWPPAATPLQPPAPSVAPAAALAMRQRCSPPSHASRVPGCPTAATVVRQGRGEAGGLQVFDNWMRLCTWLIGCSVWVTHRSPATGVTLYMSCRVCMHVCMLAEAAVSPDSVC